ncbi:aspartate kinase, partial [Candidatus Bathyarchaeota archaeon]|nr:aspartate kinase [Candidatus Bathyarchaeota archaeon]
MGNRAVIKFGGADLSTGERIMQAAKMVVQSPYEEIIVVVSAMGKMTDNLMVTISQLGGVSDADYAEIISMGERISARIFSSALKALGAQAVFIDPVNTNWPIITDSNYRNAEPSLKETKNRVQRFLIPLLGATIPVVCGFLGKDDEGKITTLGRGGSDTTALLLANFVDADETILVKDTSGVLSADPKIFPRARPIDKLDVHEMFDLVQGGAKIVKAEALKYKPPNQKLRVVSFSSENIARGGTEITGSLNT